MEQEIIKPDATPQPTSSQGFSPFGSFLATFGAALLIFCFVGSFTIATIWAFSKLLGLPDILMYGLLALGAIPVIWATIWTAGRAWNVERSLAQGQDITVPVFDKNPLKHR